MHDTFISYSRKDAEVMQKVRNVLAASGFEAWTDRELGVGDSWRRHVERAIESSRFVIVLLSPDAKSSKWVGNEINLTEIQESIPIFPLLVRGTPKESIPVSLASMHFADLRTDFDSEMQKFVAYLKRQFPRPHFSSSDPLTPDNKVPIYYQTPDVLVPLDLLAFQDVRVAVAERIGSVAKELVSHFQQNVNPYGLKALLVTANRKYCAQYKSALDSIIPSEWSRVALNLKQFDLFRNFLEPHTEPRILITSEIVFTGLDIPILSTIYLDKVLQPLSLLQLVGRLSRPYPNKELAYIVDYVGIMSTLQMILSDMQG